MIFLCIINLILDSLLSVRFKQENFHLKHNFELIYIIYFLLVIKKNRKNVAKTRFPRLK